MKRITNRALCVSPMFEMNAFKYTFQMASLIDLELCLSSTEPLVDYKSNAIKNDTPKSLLLSCVSVFVSNKSESADVISTDKMYYFSCL